MPLFHTAQYSAVFQMVFGDHENGVSLRTPQKTRVSRPAGNMEEQFCTAQLSSTEQKSTRRNRRRQSRARFGLGRGNLAEICNTVGFIGLLCVYQILSFFTVYETDRERVLTSLSGFLKSECSFVPGHREPRRSGSGFRRSAFIRGE